MRIAFVGKGGSGKTTITSLFALYSCKISSKNIYVIDADLNMHMAAQLGLLQNEINIKYLSDSDSQEDIKKHLIGKNSRILSSGHFKKTTPPSRDSNLINLTDKNNYIFKNYAIKGKENLFLSIVGTYSADKIGRSCYHDSLAIFENILTHTIDAGALLIADMVAGIDAFANTLHSQFDILIFCVEPTKKSIEVFLQYEALANEANVANNVYVVVNKLRSDDDLNFVEKFIDKKKIIGTISDSEHIRDVEKEITNLDIDKLEPNNRKTIENIYHLLSKNVEDPNKRLKKIQNLHLSYVQQGYVKDRFGDLSSQIDERFTF